MKSQTDTVNHLTPLAPAPTRNRAFVPLPLEEFAFHREWSDTIRLSQHISDWDFRQAVLKKIREFRRGREVFQGPYGDRSEWAGMVRNWYAHYLKTGEL